MIKNLKDYEYCKKVRIKLNNGCEGIFRTFDYSTRGTDNEQFALLSVVLEILSGGGTIVKDLSDPVENEPFAFMIYGGYRLGESQIEEIEIIEGKYTPKNLKDYEWCKNVYMKLIDGSEIICNTNEVDDWDDCCDSLDWLNFYVTKVIKDTGWYEARYKLHDIDRSLKEIEGFCEIQIIDIKKLNEED